jgi:hypothetical protein
LTAGVTQVASGAADASSAARTSMKQWGITSKWAYNKRESSSKTSPVGTLLLVLVIDIVEKGLGRGGFSSRREPTQLTRQHQLLHK